MNALIHAAQGIMFDCSAQMTVAAIVAVAAYAIRKTRKAGKAANEAR